LNVFAQSLVEYGSLLSNVSTAVQSALFFFQQKLGEVSQRTWVGLGLTVLLVIVFWSRRSR
jgi:hypothetical protein